MCMEDVRIGRRKKSIVRFVDVGTTWTRIITANPRRTFVRFNHNSTAGAFWYVDGNQPTSSGFFFTRTMPDVTLDVEKEGQIATGEIWAIASSGTVRVAIIETVLDDE